ncbi:MAG: winged helix-turn-helix transcriptional regulator [Bacteroidota bacterium]|nr:winged helix-turn-helix transcriptional regulator [Bacteroidota bacterium]
METTKKYGERADLALSMWVKLARAFSTFNRLTGKDIAGYGLTQPQFGVLEALGHLGPMKIGGFCEKTLASGGNITVVVDNLERDGLVERVREGDDRRTITVRLTKKGTDLFHDIFKKHAAFVSEISSVLTREEQRELSKLLKKLGTSLQKKM